MPFAESLVAMQREGKIRHIGLSNVGAAEIEAALARTPIDLCTREGIAYLPFFPLASGGASKERPVLETIARAHDASPSQIAIAWLLARSPVMLPIPGTSSPEHLEQNWKARTIALSKDEIRAIATGA